MAYILESFHFRVALLSQDNAIFAHLSVIPTLLPYSHGERKVEVVSTPVLLRRDDFEFVETCYTVALSESYCFSTHYGVRVGQS